MNIIGVKNIFLMNQRSPGQLCSSGQRRVSKVIVFYEFAQVRNFKLWKNETHTAQSCPQLIRDWHSGSLRSYNLFLFVFYTFLLTTNWEGIHINLNVIAYSLSCKQEMYSRNEKWGVWDKIFRVSNFDLEVTFELHWGTVH